MENTWEEYSWLDYIKDKIQTDPFLLDIGSGHGEFIDAFLQKNQTGMAHSYELVESRYWLLKEKFKFNTRVCVFNFGFYNKNISGANFYFMKDMEEMARLHYRPEYFPKNKTVETTVELITLDSVIDLLPIIDLMRLNVYGDEFFVFDGAKTFLKKTPPKHILIKVDKCYTDMEITFKEIIKLLNSFDYRILNRNLDVIDKNNLSKNKDCQSFLAER